MKLDKKAQDLLFRHARTATVFQDTSVPEEQIQAIYDLVKHGPTSMNQQPLRAVLVRSTEARERLVRHMFDNNKPKTLAAPLSIILAADLEFHQKLPELFPAVPHAKEMFSEPAIRTASATMNTAIQLGYFIVGVRAAGLAAAPMSGFDPKTLNAEFFPDGRLAAVAVMNVGIPADGSPAHPRLPRLAYEDVFTTV
ncbi:malonic semialdehyde reductase [Lentzea alba]|uniref:malonic semialdehyde reductase n=1 Tax=Lentzea alba TaxID=2714351 RepID=UPI0039BF7F42